MPEHYPDLAPGSRIQKNSFGECYIEVDLGNYGRHRLWSTLELPLIAAVAEVEWQEYAEKSCDDYSARLDAWLDGKAERQRMILEALSNASAWREKGRGE